MHNRHALLFAHLVIFSACECSPQTPVLENAAQSPPAPAAAQATRSTAAPVEEVAWESVDPPSVPGALGLNLRETSKGVVATWVEPEAHRVRFSLWANDAWSEPTTVVSDEALVANWADFPRSVEGGDGAFYINAMLQAGESPYAYEVHLWRSGDEGMTFDALGLLHHDGTETEHGFVSMAPTDDGVRVFWLDGRGNAEEDGTTAVYSASVHGGGQAARIDAEAVVDPMVCDCCQTDAALGADEILVAYRDRAEGEIRDIALARIGPLGVGQPSSVHRDNWEMAGCPVNGPALAADGRRAVVAWFTGAEGGAVKLAFSEGAGFASPLEIDGNQPPGRVDVALLEGGAAVSWLARGESGGEVRVRFVSTDGVQGTPTMVRNGRRGHGPYGWSRPHAGSHHNGDRHGRGVPTRASTHRSIAARRPSRTCALASAEDGLR